MSAGLRYLVFASIGVVLAGSIVARAARAEAQGVDLLQALPGIRWEPGTDRIVGSARGETIALAIGVRRALVGTRDVELPAAPWRDGARILVSPEALDLLSGGDGARLAPVLPPDADEEEEEEEDAAAPAGPLVLPASAPRIPRVAPRSWKAIRNIVIDPGHGGHDAGAIGPRGLREKDVVLDISRRVTDLLRAHGGQQAVHMTRSEDVFIPLPGRVEIAKQRNADLFVSIHINSMPRRRRSRRRVPATGTEVYYFSDPSDADAARVAASEGEFDVSQSSMNPVLFDLLLQGNVIESSALARAVHARLPGAIGLPPRGVKTARFYVLHYGVVSNIPSILIEVGFVSNPAEEAKLRDPAFRQRAAESIAESLVSFGRDLETRYPDGRGWRRN